MRKFLTFISIVFLFSSLFQKQASAQVVTEIRNIQMCYDANASMPVVVQNMQNVDAFRLVLLFNSNIIGFVEHYALNAALAGGFFAVEDDTDSIVISWARTSTASLANDTLVWLTFRGITGISVLNWNTSNSFYHTTGGNAVAFYVDGNAVVGPKIGVLLTEIDPTCTSKNDANYMANANGGTPPLSYLWDGGPGRFDSIQTGMRSGKHLITITDLWGCRLDSIFTINGLPGANVKLIVEGNEDTTIYLQNPVLKFSFQEVYPTHVVEPPTWEFGDGDTAVSFNPTHVYAKANTSVDPFYDLKLHVINENGCDSTIVFRLPIKEAKLKIPGVITPNGDSYNESFMILNENKNGSGEEIKVTEEFQRMELIIFDRWGRKIYDDSNYQSDWVAEGVPDGSYYYKLKTVGFYRTDNYKGSITVLGSGASQ